MVSVLWSGGGSASSGAAGCGGAALDAVLEGGSGCCASAGPIAMLVQNTSSSQRVTNPASWACLFIPYDVIQWVCRTQRGGFAPKTCLLFAIPVLIKYIIMS